MASVIFDRPGDKSGRIGLGGIACGSDRASALVEIRCKSRAQFDAVKPIMDLLHQPGEQLLRTGAAVRFGRRVLTKSLGPLKGRKLRARTKIRFNGSNRAYFASGSQSAQKG